jgi:nondiscriminating glutamyl-tRNA synthetase
MEEVRVRFAPSPTGFLHVGGARTAIFNWLLARNRNGKFLLRIEDTDLQRSKSELTDQIIRSLKWLGMESDEPVVYQSDNIERYKEIVKKLVENKKAYCAFETPEEIEAKRKEAIEKKLPFTFYRDSLKYDEDTVKKFINKGKPYSIRFYVPGGVTRFNDMVHGWTSFQNSEIDDFVILRSDGSPVYQIAVVVDDHDMNITHVIRGDDHLSNTPKQILLYEALGWDVPQFAHLPLIHDEQKKKLSKRRNTVSVEEYKELGYLSDALFNFLTLLGFAPADNKEIVSREELVSEFTFDRVNKKSAVFDMNKLNWINAEYIKSADEKYLGGLLREKIESILKINPDDFTDEYLLGVIRLMRERAQVINEIIEKGKFFFLEPETYDEKGLTKYWNHETKKLIQAYLEILEKNNNDEFAAAILDEQLRKFAEQNGVKAGTVIHPLRLALTGTTASPGIFELMEVLGKNKVKTRIEKLLT